MEDLRLRAAKTPKSPGSSLVRLEREGNPGAHVGAAMDEDALREAFLLARHGDREAASRVHGVLAPRVLGLCRRLLRSEEDAEDAASETFLRAQRSMSKFDPDRSVSRWFLAIAGNLCVDRLRRGGLEQRIFEPADERVAPARGPSPLEAAAGREERAHVAEAIEALPEKYRVPMILRYVSGESYEEIGSTLGLRRSHVATLLFRGRLEVRRLLEKKGIGA